MGSCRGRAGGGALACALSGDMLSVAGPVDVDANGVHGEAVEDGGGERGVAQEAPPVAERDIRSDRRGDLAMPTIDEVVEGVRGGRLVAALLDLPETDVIDDEERGSGPGLESARVRAVGEAGVEIVEQVDAACIAHADALLARAEPEGFEDMTLAGAGLAGDDEVVASSNEVESCELEDQRLVELGLEIPVEGFERLSFHEAADVNASRDAVLELSRGLETEDVLEQDCGAGPLGGGPGESLVELVEGERQSEEREVSAQALEDEVVVGARIGVVSMFAVSLGHAGIS